MRVLLMGSGTGEGSAAAEALRGEGHELLRCHHPGEPSFPCAGLIDGEQCPLDSGTVDAAVAVGTGCEDQLGIGPDGSRCALRQHIPLVTVGYHYASPLVEWATESVIASDNLATVVTRAAGAPMPTHEQVARDLFRTILDAHGHADIAADVGVHRSTGSLRVELRADAELPAAVAEVASVRILGALREIDRHATTISVTIGDTTDHAVTATS